MRVWFSSDIYTCFALCDIPTERLQLRLCLSHLFGWKLQPIILIYTYYAWCKNTKLVVLR